MFFAHRQSPAQQSAAGYGVGFEWDSDLLAGYRHHFLKNIAKPPGTNRFLGCDTPEIAQLIVPKAFDVVLVTGWHLKSYWQALWACRRQGIPIVVRGDSQLGTPRGPVKRLVKELLYPLLLRTFNGALFVGQRNREYLTHYGVEAERLFFSPHCVDTREFAGRAEFEQRQAIRASWGVPASGSVALFVGRFLPFKRPSDVVLALQLLKNQGADVLGVFAGAGELRPELEAMGLSLGVPLIFLGFCNQSKLPAVYAAADVLVLPSSGQETWGLVVNEALACGTPCAVSDACGCGPDMIVDGITGKVFPAGDVPALVSAIAQCILIPRESSAIRAHSERYSVAAAATGVLHACNSLLSKVPGE